MTEVVRPEGNAEINAAKQERPELGAMVYLHVRNETATPLALRTISWADAGHAVSRLLHPSASAPLRLGVTAVVMPP